MRLAFTLLALLSTCGTAAAQSADAARAFLTDAVERYRNMQTYQDEFDARLITEVIDENGDDIGINVGGRGKLLLRNPDQVALITQKVTLYYADGRVTWVKPELAQYLQATTDTPPQLSPFMLRFSGPLSQHPVAIVTMARDKSLAELFGVEVLGTERAERDGVPGRWITLRGTLGVLPKPTPVQIRLWFDDADRLLREMRIDLKPHYTPGVRLPGAGGPGTTTKRAEVVLRLEEIQVNEPLDDDAVVFDPPTGFRKMEMFDARLARDEQQALVGRRAPDFAGQNLAGKTVRLADYKDRVIVLDFWAIWCAPCVEMLPTVQAVAKHFADEPVTVLGVNRDGRKAHKRVARFLKGKQIDLPQLLDIRDEAIKAFHVKGIPCTVIVDRAGMIRDIHVGPETKEDLVRKIEAALRPAPTTQPAAGTVSNPK
jgi:peroxiredoxin/outer membrane lipoprotein-sorting protein